MISRKTTRYNYTQEPLQQNSFTAMKGIDSSKAPTSPDTLLNAKNLDVDYDGGLVLRKPIVYKTIYSNNVLKAHLMYDNTSTLLVTEKTLKVAGATTYVYKYTDIYGKTHSKNNSVVDADFTNCKLLNTSTSTLVTNVPVTLPQTSKPALYNSYTEPSQQYRLFKIYKDSENWVIEMITPEPNSIQLGDIPLDYNLTLNKPDAVRDNYYSSATTVTGILGYRVSNNVTPTVEDTDWNDSMRLKDEVQVIVDISAPYEASGVTKRNVVIKILTNSVFTHTYDAIITDPFDRQTFILEKFNLIIDLNDPPTSDEHLYLLDTKSKYTLYREKYVEYDGNISILYRVIYDTVVTKTFIDSNIGYHIVFSADFSKETVSVGLVRSKITYVREITFQIKTLDGSEQWSKCWGESSSDSTVSITDSEFDFWNTKSREGLLYFNIAVSYYDYSNVRYAFKNVYVDTLTEGAYKVVQNVDYEASEAIILKAFIDKPNVNSTNVYAKWERSLDGVVWDNITTFIRDSECVNAAFISEDVDYTLESDDLKKRLWDTERYTLLDLPKYEDRRAMPILERADCLWQNLTEDSKYLKYRFTIVTLEDAEDTTYLPDGVSKVVSTVLSSKEYTIPTSVTTVSDFKFKQPLKGKMLYWKHALYAYGNGLDSDIYASNVDSAIFPLSRLIDLGTYQKSNVTKILPWRDYLLAFTENSVHLLAEQEVGFTTKVVNTYTGVSERDAETCVAILNGVIFKEGSKIYTLAPNYTSGVDTILNLTEVSKPIEHLLNTVQYSSVHNPFAFTTSEQYVLFIPNNLTTVCLKYDYGKKLWTYHEYPKVFSSYYIKSADKIVLVTPRDAGDIEEYYFDKDIDEFQINVSDTQVYGDWLKNDKGDGRICVPIQFFVDSGQKTDNIALTKQFVESKIIVATVTAKDNFKMDVRVDIEGTTFKKHTDLNTDGALLRDKEEYVLTLGSNLNYDNSDDKHFNTMRQLFLRYSGKGKTIRHIISGESLYKFKLYEVYYRYKLLNFKQ